MQESFCQHGILPFQKNIKFSIPPIYLHSIFAIFQFEMSSLMSLIFSLFQTWILQAEKSSSNWEKNPVHQTGYFKLENCKNKCRQIGGQAIQKSFLSPNLKLHNQYCHNTLLCRCPNNVKFFFLLFFCKKNRSLLAQARLLMHLNTFYLLIIVQCIFFNQTNC